MASGSVSIGNGWDAEWTHYCPPNVSRHCECVRRDARVVDKAALQYSTHWGLVDVVFVQHVCADGGEVEYFLHRVCEHSTPDEVVEVLNEVGKNPPVSLERYRGVYRTLGEVITVEIADWSWIQRFWLKRMPTAEFLDKWREQCWKVRGDCYERLPGWIAARKMVSNVFNAQ